MSNKIETAFIFAAGKGTRLRPYTDDTPKPLVRINNRPILDYTFDLLYAYGIKKIIINANYLRDSIQNYIAQEDRFETIISIEDEHYETGGGLIYAKEIIGKKPLFAINGDALWEDADGSNALQEMNDLWHQSDDDIMLMLQPKNTMTLTQGLGDYDIEMNNQKTYAIRNKSQNGDYMFTGVRVMHPRILDGISLHSFSYRELMDKAQEQQKLTAYIHKGQWHHISTPDDLHSVDKHFKNR